MDTDSDNFSEVESMSDITRDFLQVKCSFIFELDRCIQFASTHQKINSLPDYNCQLLTLPQMYHVQEEEQENREEDIFLKKRLTFGMKSDQANVLQDFKQQETSYFGHTQENSESQDSSSTQAQSSFTYLQNVPQVPNQKQTHIPMHAVLKLRDLNVSNSSTCSEKQNSNEMISNLKLDINKLKQKYYDQLPDSLRQNLKP